MNIEDRRGTFSASLTASRLMGGKAEAFVVREQGTAYKFYFHCS